MNPWKVLDKTLHAMRAQCPVAEDGYRLEAQLRRCVHQIVEESRMTDEEETLAHYRTMSTEDLQQLKTAFQTDRKHAVGQSTIDFCEGRLKLIDWVLHRRAQEPA